MIKEKRLKFGWTQDYLGKKIGVTKQAISYYENGARIPRYDILENIHRELKLNNKQKEELRNFFIDVSRKRKE